MKRRAKINKWGHQLNIKNNTWRDWEIKYIRDNVNNMTASEMVADKLEHRTAAAIVSKANKHGYLVLMGEVVNE